MEPIHNFHPPVCCWNCDHFQRYDEEQRPKQCDGECRLNPAPGALFITDYIEDPTDQGQFGHNKELCFSWPHITCGLRMRCASFEKSTEPDLPQSPLSYDCQHTKPTDIAEWRPWVRPDKLLYVCWSCNWFEPELCQRKYKEQPDNGTCLYMPPRPQQIGFFEQLIPSQALGATPSILGALSYWCSKWAGPRPEISFGSTPVLAKPLNDGDDQPMTRADIYTHWEDRHNRLVWLASAQLAKVQKVREQMKAAAREAARKQESRIITLDDHLKKR